MCLGSLAVLSAARHGQACNATLSLCQHLSPGKAWRLHDMQCVLHEDLPPMTISAGYPVTQDGLK